jgi:hypothetical protein
LTIWAQEKFIVRAEHFFWILGEPVQKSREGLLRHLLHSALLSLSSSADYEDLELKWLVLGSRRLSNGGQRAWAYDELFEMFLRLTSFPNVKFVFSIDALDECEPQDRLGELADEIKKISDLPNVKLCVSCRPWNQFIRRFHSTPTVKLDSLTYHDMKLYVSNRLASAEGEGLLCSEFRECGMTTRAKSLVTHVAHASDGVFLWTELVVKALCSELRKGRDFEFLEKTLLDFPVGLDEYFQELLLNRVTKSRQNVFDTAAALLLGLKTTAVLEDKSNCMPHPRSFINFWLLGEGYLKPGLSWRDCEGRWLLPEDSKTMVRQTRAFLEESCKELLVLVDRRSGQPKSQSQLDWDVEFLHRTVPDFLNGDRLRLILEEQSKGLYNDGNIFVQLEKLRCMYLSRELWMSFDRAEQDFYNMIRESQRSGSSDRAWLLECEISVAERLGQIYNMPCEYPWQELEDKNMQLCIKVGLTAYPLAIIKRWPHHVITDPSDNYLNGFLDGYLEFAFGEVHVEAPDQILSSGIRGMKGSWSHDPFNGYGRPGLRKSTLGILTMPLTSAPECSRIKLLKRILECGTNPNQQGNDWRVSRFGSRCSGTIWQSWLKCVYLRLKQHKMDSGAREQSTGSHVQIELVKRMISGIIVVLLQHGADPTCTLCISDHMGKNRSCDLVSLASVLASVTSRDSAHRVHTLRALCSLRFDRDRTRKNYMLRAMASWEVSGSNGYLIYKNADRRKRFQHRIGPFLHSFIANTEGWICGACAKWNNDDGYMVASCLDCNDRYYLCGNCIRDRFPEEPTHYEISRHLTHGRRRLSSGAQHTYLCFGYKASIDPTAVRLYSPHKALSTLENWYANSTNNVDEDASVITSQEYVSLVIDIERPP